MNWLRRIGAFIARWWKWLVGVLLLLASMSALHRAEQRRDKANARIRDDMGRDIGEHFDAVDADTTEFLNAQDAARRANEKVSKALDRIAEPKRSVGDAITDWNARNRGLHDDAGSP